MADSVKEPETDAWTVTKTESGTYDMGIVPGDFKNTNPNFTNVEFVIVDGQLVINPITDEVVVTITEHSDEVDYDGKVHTVEGYDVSIGNELYTEADFTFKGNDKVSGTNAGTYDMELKPEDFTNINKNFANVTFVIVDGQLVIDPIDLKIIIDNKTKVYGTADPKFTFTVEGLAEGETIPEDAVTLWRDEGEDVGTYTIYGKMAEDDSATTKAVVQIVLDKAAGRDSKAFVAGNYNVTFQEGELEITPAKVTVKANDASKVVGEADPTFTATVTGLRNGDDESVISYTLNRDPGEDPGKYAITPEGETDQGNYIVEFVPGTLTITVKKQFTFFWVSDTLLKGEGAYDDAFKAIAEYAGKNAGKAKAAALVSTGNIVDAFDNEDAWTSAKNGLAGLRTPFLSVAGTKDVNGDEMNYDAYLAAKLNSNVSAFEDGSVWFKTFGQYRVTVVGIGYQKIAETDEEKERQDKWLNFVNNAVASHKGDKVILVVNDYMDASGALTEFGKFIEEKVVEGNENICVVLCGNADGEAHKEMTYGERKVAVVMFNYAADEENGLGFMRVVTLDMAKKSLTIETINAITGEPAAYDANNPDADSFTIENLF